MTKRFKGDPAATTLTQAKQWLREAVPVPKPGGPLSEGAECPCCRQFVKIYRRKMDASKALSLILFVREWPPVGEDWVHVPDFLKKGGPQHQEVLRSREWPRLADFGLIERKKDVRDDGSPKTGLYRLTPLGVEFAKGRTKVPECLTMYEGMIYGKSPELVSIQEALGVKFSYSDLMAGT